MGLFKWQPSTYRAFELLWLEYLLTELDTPFYPPTLLDDNLSVVMTSQYSILHAYTKHIELDIQFNFL